MRLLRDLNARAGGLSPTPIDRPLVLYGAGNLGKLARSHLDLAGVPIAFVVDANAAALRDDPDWVGLDVVAPEDVSSAIKRDVLLAISIVTSSIAPMQEGLSQAGWARCVPFYDIAEGFRAKHPLGNGWFAETLNADHLHLCDDVLNGWADDASRAHHLNFAAWRLCREEWSFTDAPIDPGSRYFIDEIRSALTLEEYVLDGGAHHGTYLARLLTERDCYVSQAWAIEPDAANRAILERWTKTLEPLVMARTTILDSMLGAGAKTVRFHDGLGYASQIAATGHIIRETQSIDAMDLNPSVIKLHLEGAERSALEGARGTMRRFRPIVMATVYHNEDGLARTAHWLMHNLKDYRFLMRMHGWCGTGAVVYAIPVERFVS